MLGLWIIGLAFIAGGLAAIGVSMDGLETPFRHALLGSGLIFVSSGVVISAVGVVVRVLGQLRHVLEAAGGLPSFGSSDPVPAIATATVERPSLQRSGEPAKRATVDQATTPDDAARAPAGGLLAAPLRGPLAKREAPAAPPPPAVVYSGTVDNMHYQLRADGTIVALLSGRRMEFASIDELRSHFAAAAQDEAPAPSRRSA